MENGKIKTLFKQKGTFDPSIFKTYKQVTLNLILCDY